MPQTPLKTHNKEYPVQTLNKLKNVDDLEQKYTIPKLAQSS